MNPVLFFQPLEVAHLLRHQPRRWVGAHGLWHPYIGSSVMNSVFKLSAIIFIFGSVLLLEGKLITFKRKNNVHSKKNWCVHEISIFTEFTVDHDDTQETLACGFEYSSSFSSNYLTGKWWRTTMWGCGYKTAETSVWTVYLGRRRTRRNIVSFSLKKTHCNQCSAEQRTSQQEEQCEVKKSFFYLTLWGKRSFGQIIRGKLALVALCFPATV